MLDLRVLRRLALAHVCFGAGEVQFDFGVAALTAYTPPSVDTGDDWVAYPGAGSRDAFCALAGQFVTGTAVTEAEVRLTFGNGHVLALPRRSQDPAVTEAVILQDRDGAVATW